MLSNYRMNFMKMSPDKRYTNRKTDVDSGERYYELTGDLFSLAFYSFYIDEEEREENFILNHILEQERIQKEKQKELGKSNKDPAFQSENLRISLSAFKEQLSQLKLSQEDYSNHDIIEHLKIKMYLRRLHRGRILSKLVIFFSLEISLVVLLFNYFV